MTAKYTPREHVFDAETWVRQHLRDAPTLQPETLHAVSGFALIWSLFEGLICDHRASIVKFEEVVQRLVYTDVLIEEIARCISYYQFRYLTNGETNHRFTSLNFRENDRKQFVEAVLQGKSTSPTDQMFAILIITYRIRNNLFHGLKSVRDWNDQARNISHAAKVLALALEGHGEYVVVPRSTA